MRALHIDIIHGLKLHTGTIVEIPNRKLPPFPSMVPHEGSAFLPEISSGSGVSFPLDS